MNTNVKRNIRRFQSVPNVYACCTGKHAQHSSARAAAKCFTQADNEGKR